MSNRFAPLTKLNKEIVPLLSLIQFDNAKVQDIQSRISSLILLYKVSNYCGLLSNNLTIMPFYKLFKNNLKLSILIYSYLASFSCTSIAQAKTSKTTSTQAESIIQFYQSSPLEELNLHITQTSIAQTIKFLHDKTGIIFHFSNLPEEQINLNCQGDLKAVLSCVIGEESNIIYRYNSHSRDKAKIAEAWILPIAINSAQVDSSEQTNAKISTFFTNNIRIDNTVQLLKDVENPKLRMSAIEQLAIEGQQGDVTTYNTLKKSLSDPNPGIRAQALYGIIRQDQENTLPFLQQAMSDSHADVRLMAVDNCGDNPWILQQALNDNDINVRDLAKAKLAIQNTNKQQP
ncbi:MAG: HEAT repeat domain-containing protein [Methylococcaceae bacterium]